MQFGKARRASPTPRSTTSWARSSQSLQAHGTAEIASVYGSYPLIRSRNTNLYARLAFDAKTFQDKVDVTASVTDSKPAC